MSNAFKCDKCETYYDFFFQHPKIVLEDETRMYLCRDCVGEYREIINLWLGKGYFSKEFNEKISSMLNKEKKENKNPST
uniref:Uncharacterized protein n=1 Tax=viral metagenome TaxID=1070528 RepID=A0A6M3XYV6_9ZZZZ